MNLKSRKIISMALVFFMMLTILPMAPVTAHAAGTSGGGFTLSGDTAEWNVSISDAGVLSWDDKGSGYTYTISIAEFATGGTVTDIDDLSTNSCNLKAKFEERKIESGYYYFMIEAKKGGSTISTGLYDMRMYYVSALPKLAEPQNLQWTASGGQKWDPVEGADGYYLYLYDESGNNKGNVYRTATEGTFWADDGYWFEVVATADGYRNSNVAESPKYGEVVTPEPIVISELNATVVAPVAGEVPSTVVTTTGEGYTVSVAYWYDKDDNTDFSKFEAGGLYEVQVTFTPEEGYVLADEDVVTATINGKTAEVYMSRPNTGALDFGIKFDKLEAETPEPTKYTVKFDSDGGSAVTEQTIEEGGQATKPENPTKEGYTFKGWTLNESAYDFSAEVTGDITLKAVWEVIPAKYTITYTDGVDGKVIFADKVFENVVDGSDTPAFGDAPTRSGYTFKGWSPAVAEKVTGNQTYTATWQKRSSGSSYGGGSYVAPDKDADSKLRIVMQINNKNILVNGKTMVNDVAPVIVGDRTLVPIRVVTELLGGSADWDNAPRTVTLKIDGKTMNMTIGKEIPGFGTSAVIMNDRTYVPVRYVMEKLGAEVEWIGATRQIIIEK